MLWMGGGGVKRLFRMGFKKSARAPVPGCRLDGRLHPLFCHLKLRGLVFRMRPGLVSGDFERIAPLLSGRHPFYRNGFLGDLLYTGILFGSYELFLRWTSRISRATLTVSR